MKYLRDRVLEPIVIPLLAVALIGFGALNLSRFFLAAGGTGAVMVAALVSLLVLVGATLATSRPEPLPRGTLLGGMALLGFMLSGFGILANEIDLDREAEHEEAEGPEVSSVLDVTAVDIDFVEKELEASPGNVQVNYVNQGQTVHTFVFEGVDDFKLEVPSEGATDSGIVALEAGDYVYFCDVPGHRAAGMEGTLTVAEGLGTPPAGGGAAGGAVVTVPAVDIDFPQKQFEAEAGTVAFEYVNEGETAHTLVVEGREDDMKLEVQSNGDTDQGQLELEPGTYVLYCDVPGHRSAGMEATLTVT